MLIFGMRRSKVGKCISKIPFKETKRHTRGIVFTYKVYKGADKLKKSDDKNSTLTP